MNTKYKLGLGAAAIALLLSGAAVAGGIYTNGFPATPTPLTGSEQIPLDTQLSGGQQPQTAYVTMAQLKDWQVIALSNSTPSTTSLDATTAALYTLTLTDNALIGPPSVASGTPFKIQFTQDSTGGRTVTFDATYKWFGGTNTVTATAGRISVADCYYNGSINVCNLLQNLTP